MNWRRGLTRLWIGLSVLWVALIVVIFAMQDDDPAAIMWKSITIPCAAGTLNDEEMSFCYGGRAAQDVTDAYRKFDWFVVLALGGPLASLGVTFAGIWIARGFAPHRR